MSVLSDAPETMSRITQRRSWIILGILIGIVSVVHVLWVLKDQVPLPVEDSYAYLTKLFRFIDGFSADPRPRLSRAITQLSLVGRPPLYQISTLPFVLVFGRSTDAALLVNLVFLAILAIATYNIGRLAKNSHAGLLAAFLVLTYAPIIRVSRMYLPHFATCALGALSLWLLLSLVDRRSIKTAWFLGLSLTAGLLNHPFFALILFVPTAVTGIYLLLFQTEPRRPPSLQGLPAWFAAKCRDRFVIRGLLPAALIAVVPMVLWLMIWGGPGMSQLVQHGSSTVARGVGFPQISPTFWWYALTTPGAISSLFALFLGVGLVGAAVKRQTKALILLVAFLAAYLNYTMLPIRVWWHYCAVLPLVAVLSVLWIADIRRKWLSTSLIAALVLVGTFNFFLVTWGGNQTWATPLAGVLGAPLSDNRTCDTRYFAAFCPDHARAQPRFWDEMAATLRAEPACQTDQPCRVLFVGLPQARMIVNYTLVRRRIKNVATHRLSRSIPFDFEALIEYDFIVYPEAGPNRSVYSATIGFLRTPPPEFAEAHQIVDAYTIPVTTDYSSFSSARLIKRIEAVSLEEVEASIASINLPDAYEFQAFGALSRAYAQEGDMERALEFYRRIPTENASPLMRRTQNTTRNFLTREFMALAETHHAQADTARAVSFYETVLELNSRHRAATRALRQLTEPD